MGKKNWPRYSWAEQFDKPDLQCTYHLCVSYDRRQRWLATGIVWQTP